MLALPGGLLPPPAARKGRNKQQQVGKPRVSLHTELPKRRLAVRESCWWLCQVRGAGTPALEPPACASSAPEPLQNLSMSNQGAGKQELCLKMPLIFKYQSEACFV